MNFRLSTPRRETFLVSVVIAILVIIGMIVPLPFLHGLRTRPIADRLSNHARGRSAR